jgi:D-3-phosphoglycerate dehydrogenase
VKKWCILNAEPAGYSVAARETLASVATVDHLELTRSELLAAIPRYDGLIVRLGHQVGREIFDAGSRLQFVATATTGLNHINLEEARKRSIDVLSLRGEKEFLDQIWATAELTWALLLGLTRHIPGAALHTRKGGWEREAFIGRELAGKVLGIVGGGRLGSKVAGYGAAFAMRVLVCDPKYVALPPQAERVSLPELLTHSDIISIHVPYEPATHHLLGVEALARVKRGSVVINTSRGEVLDESAIVAALKDGRLSGFAGDVVSGEGGIDWKEFSPLFRYAGTAANILLTPHIGGLTHESMAKTELFMAEKIKRYLMTQER